MLLHDGLLELFYPFYQGHFIDHIEMFRALRTHANNAHNELLEVWGQTGILGLGAFLWNLEIVDYTPKPFRSGSSFAVRVGGGVELPVGEHWFFSAEFSYFAPISDVVMAPLLGGVDDLDHVGIGGVVRYLF